MKIFFLLALLVSLAVALELSQLEGRAGQRRPHKRTSRPKKFDGAFTMRAPNRPSNAPSAYKTGTGRTGRKRSKAGLKKLPSDLIDKDSSRRRDSYDTLRRLRRQSTANDYYECSSANPAPNDADCNVIIDQVFASNDNLQIAANSCLTFVYQKCEAFFCSLCQTIGTNTDFIGNQLDSAESLCIAGGGQDGTIIGTDPPQWDAGFVYPGDDLPTYDVC